MVESISQTRPLSSAGILQKVYDFRKADETRNAGVYPYFRAIQSTAGTDVYIGGQKKIMVGSNNYLGLTTHPRVIEAAKRALDAYGTGCTGSRFLNGTLDIHLALEQEISDFNGYEDTLVISTGFQSNLSAISCLVGRHDLIFCDEENHASIYDACRLSFGKMVRYKHNNILHLEQLLRQYATVPGKLIITDGVFSMSGDIAPLPDLVGLSRRHQATLLVDDAHAVGVLGPQGEGTPHHFGLRDEIDIVTATFSKSFASIGGFVSAKRKVIDYIRHHGRAYIFSASLPPASVATVRECLRLLQEEPRRLQNLWANVSFVVGLYRKYGIPIQNDQTPIIPILIGDEMATFAFNQALFEAGVFANPVITPAVPPGKGAIRTSYMATHAEEELAAVADIIRTLFVRFGLPLQGA
jgi:8-amino-7-oxononanoate synthase